VNLYVATITNALKLKSARQYKGERRSRYGFVHLNMTDEADASRH